MQSWLKPKIAVAGDVQFKLYPLIFVKNLCLCMRISITLIAEAAWLPALLLSPVLCTVLAVSLSEVLSSSISHRQQGICKYLISLNIMTALSGVEAFLKSVSEWEIWSLLSRRKLIQTWKQNVLSSIFLNIKYLSKPENNYKRKVKQHPWIRCQEGGESNSHHWGYKRQDNSEIWATQQQERSKQSQAMRLFSKAQESG